MAAEHSRLEDSMHSSAIQKLYSCETLSPIVLETITATCKPLAASVHQFCLAVAGNAVLMTFLVSLVLAVRFFTRRERTAAEMTKQ